MGHDSDIWSHKFPVWLQEATRLHHTPGGPKAVVVYTSYIHNSKAIIIKATIQA